MSGSRVRWSRSGPVAAIVAGAVLLAGGVLVHPEARAVVAPPPPYIPVYNLTDLGMLSGDTGAFAFSINATGGITGGSNRTGREQAFRYAGATMTGLGWLNVSDDGSEGEAINASGVVAGLSGQLSDFTTFRAVTWTGAAAPVDISGGVTSIADGINDAGTTVGFTEASPGSPIAFVRPAAGPLTDLNTLVMPGESFTLKEALAINTSGQIVGYMASPGQPDTAFLFDSTLATFNNRALDPLRSGDGNVATAINDAGHAVGYEFGTLNHPFYWDGTTMHDLGTLPGYSGGQAYGINASDWVVGEVDNGDNGPFRATVWAGGATADLNTRVKLPPGWVLEFANGINDAGAIVGEAQVNGHPHAFRLTPSNVSRTFGADRYTTAAQISAKNFSSPQATVYIADGQNFPDALSGAALAGHKGAPLLLVPATGALPASVATELQRLAPTNIVIFGGIGAVSDAMLANIQTATGVTPTRIAGTDRYDTAARISAQDYTSPQAKVYIANGQNFPDALGGAALAGRDGAPLLLVPATGPLPAPVLTELQRLVPTSIVIFGGTGAVSDAMLANIQTATGVTPTRTFGATRYDTAAAIASTYYTNPQPLVFIANGQNFPDALAGAALAAGKGAPLLLVPTSGALPTSVSNELNALGPTSIVIFGGPGAVSTSMEELIANY